MKEHIQSPKPQPLKQSKLQAPTAKIACGEFVGHTTDSWGFGNNTWIIQPEHNCWLELVAMQATLICIVTPRFTTRLSAPDKKSRTRGSRSGLI